MVHVPVMVEEVMKYLDVEEGGTYIDATAGAGGHLKEIVERVGEKGRVIAIDQDRKAVEYLKKHYFSLLPELSRRGNEDPGRKPFDSSFVSQTRRPLRPGCNVVVVRGNFRYIEKIVKSSFRPERSEAEKSHTERNERMMRSLDFARDDGEKEGLVDGILFDLGFSLDEVQEKGRGFSFEDDESLDMRYGQGEHGEFLCECHTPKGEIPNPKFQIPNNLQIQNSKFQNRRMISAEDAVNTFSERELADIFWKYGDERKSKFFAKKIVEYRRKKRIKSAEELAYVIGSARPKLEGFQALVRHAHSDAPLGGSESRPERRLAYPAPFEVFQKKLPSSSCLQEKSGRKVRGQRAAGGRLHPATKVFLALRIFVNRELESLEEGLEGSVKILKRGGRCVVVSFHSGEDRIVKTFIRTGAFKSLLENLTKHVVKPSREEILRNRLARSAVLRAFEKK